MKRLSWRRAARRNRFRSRISPPRSSASSPDPEKRNRLLNPRERRIVAFHEMGHAIVAMALPDTDPIKKVSIIPRGIGALGYTMQMPTEDRYLMTRTELLNRMTVLLGGRAAEMVIFAEATTGAADDLQRATEMARAMVTRYGMEPEIGQASLVSERPRYLDLSELGQRQSEASDETNAKIDNAIRNLIEQAFNRACDILRSCARVHPEFGATSARQGNLCRRRSCPDTGRRDRMSRSRRENDIWRRERNAVKGVSSAVIEFARLRCRLGNRSELTRVSRRHKGVVRPPD